MALPKRKHSKSRRDKSRTHWKLARPAVTQCPQCAKPVQPHRVCLHCGFYRGKAVMAAAPQKKTDKS